jgi:hypothetical protein
MLFAPASQQLSNCNIAGAQYYNSKSAAQYVENTRKSCCIAAENICIAA